MSVAAAIANLFCDCRLNGVLTSPGIFHKDFGGSIVKPNEAQTLLTTPEAADFLRLSPRTLERLRVQGTGPKYRKAGSGLRARVLYELNDLNAWLVRKYTSTSEYPPRQP